MNDEPIPLIAYVFVTITSFVLAYASIDDKATTEEPKQEETIPVAIPVVEEEQKPGILSSLMPSTSKPEESKPSILNNLMPSSSKPEEQNPGTMSNLMPSESNPEEPNKIGGKKNKTSSNKKKQYKKLNKSKKSKGYKK